MPPHRMGSAPYALSRSWGLRFRGLGLQGLGFRVARGLRLIVPGPVAMFMEAQSFDEAPAKTLCTSGWLPKSGSCYRYPNS